MARRSSLRRSYRNPGDDWDENEKYRVMVDHDAREAHVGGEVLCIVA